jgi:hypothetical protein
VPRPRTDEHAAAPAAHHPAALEFIARGARLCSAGRTTGCTMQRWPWAGVDARFLGMSRSPAWLALAVTLRLASVLALALAAGAATGCTGRSRPSPTSIRAPAVLTRVAEVVAECARVQPVLAEVGEELESWTRTLGQVRDAAGYDAVAAGAERATRRLGAERPADAATRIRWADATLQAEHLSAALRQLAAAQVRGDVAALPRLIRDLRRATGGYRLAVAQLEQRCHGARVWLRG